MGSGEGETVKIYEHNQQQTHQIQVSNFAKQPSETSNLASVINQLQQHQQNSEESHSSNTTNNEKAEGVSMWLRQAHSLINVKGETGESSQMTSPSSGSVGQKSMRRRIRRKQSSPNDQAEALTEMSVRGLNLFRYASIQDGVYKCTECAKENVQKTFKNKYSFQRHAFLYHEGTQRKVFPCPVCRKEFSRPDKMKNHMKMTHDCYVPKECKYPLPLIIAGPSQTAQSLPINNNIINITTSQ